MAGLSRPAPTAPPTPKPKLRSRKGGAASARGKQFVLAPFSVIFCNACGHVYGVTPSAS